AEWYLIVAMKSPFPDTTGRAAGARGALPPYRETVFPHAAAVPGCNLVAYAREYENPWLVRAMVSIGLRATEPALLRLLASEAMERARPGSADQGAAICVGAYQALGAPIPDAGDIESLLARIRLFDAGADKNAHAHRWRISNRYAAGLLLLVIGRRDEARGAFLSCAELDPSRFSPLLATKTVDA